MNYPITLRNFNHYILNYKQLSNEFTLIDYIWIDKTGITLRSKTKVHKGNITKLSQLDWMPIAGYSSQKSTVTNHEILLKPAYMVKDPFRRHNHLLCLCECYEANKKIPAIGNFRQFCQDIVNECKEFEPRFGLEQEYYLYKRNNQNFYQPLGFPEGGFPQKDDRYYCSIGSSNADGRAFAEAHLRYCLFSGLNIRGVKSLQNSGQWQYQIGIKNGILVSDQIWLSRYILLRLGEDFGYDINLTPKPIQEQKGSNCNMNFSTKQIRDKDGLYYILEHHIPKLRQMHQEHILLYGEVDEDQQNDINDFTYAIEKRQVSIRIPYISSLKGKIYYQDRRPAASANPYLCTSIILDTTCLNSKYCQAIIHAFKQYKIL